MALGRYLLERRVEAGVKDVKVFFDQLGGQLNFEEWDMAMCTAEHLAEALRRLRNASNALADGEDA
jgi:hypothetical protein